MTKKMGLCRSVRSFLPDKTPVHQFDSVRPLNSRLPSKRNSKKKLGAIGKSAQSIEKRHAGVAQVRTEHADEKTRLKRRRSEVGPATPSGSVSQSAPELKNGGLPFSSIRYTSPLEDPRVYHMKDKAYTMETFNDLVDIIARAREDQRRMKTALIKNGFLPGSDEESEEENVFVE
ncbi:uncharacterized protein N7500_001529 [Penicillium coprophilum]|uniref:uncharacterized protein n=1 Tax=Penicillium coprophilum TaxID=36646 RepID=UPI0023A60593|nr:uncharacterized protein N7500_001529 [Penicillium coprophilum]KAJ5173598.1 hypothetical protein N7500_001529 [Penicillium coprophilum]